MLDGMKKVDPNDPEQIRRVHMYVISQGGRSRGVGAGGGSRSREGRGGRSRGAGGAATFLAIPLFQ